MVDADDFLAARADEDDALPSEPALESARDVVFEPSPPELSAPDDAPSLPDDGLSAPDDAPSLPDDALSAPDDEPSAPAATGVESAPPSPAAFSPPPPAARCASFFAQPEPLKWMAGVLNALRIRPPQTSHLVGPFSAIECLTSMRRPQAVQTYS